MKIRVGTGLYGYFHQPDGTYIATKFFHIIFIPMIPLGTVRVQSETNDGYIGHPADFSFASLVVAYLKAWLFLGGLGLIAWGVYMWDRSAVPWSMFLGVPLGGLAAMVLSISMQLWLGTAPRRTGRIKTPLLAIGIPCILVLGSFGYWWWDRLQFDRMIERNRAEDAAKEEAARDARQKEADAYTERYRRSYAYVEKFDPIVRAIYDQDWVDKPCDDARLQKSLTSERAAHLLAADHTYIIWLPKSGEATREELRGTRAWMASKSLVDYAIDHDPAKLDDIDKRPFAGFVMMADLPRDKKRPKGKRLLASFLTVYHIASGEYLCGIQFEVDSTGAAGAEPPPLEIQSAFKAAARKSLATITKVLHIYEDE